ncbi:hypothetical protein [Jiella sp. M17.18]|uniref:hypothetical protein n=1 Tax=Jiella sp. M17.18 TaxID=3234247 RepID=UPI0034DEB936
MGDEIPSPIPFEEPSKDILEIPVPPELIDDRHCNAPGDLSEDRLERRKSEASRFLRGMRRPPAPSAVTPVSAPGHLIRASAGAFSLWS